jgi:hypothetical protein
MAQMSIPAGTGRSACRGPLASGAPRAGDGPERERAVTCLARSSRWFAALLLAGVAALACACTPAPTPPLAGANVPFADAAALVEYLQSSGLKLEPLGTVKYGWFAAPASTYQAGPSASEVLYVHQFASPAEADSAARRVSPDGLKILSPENMEMTVQWQGEPHFYESGPLIVLYVGADPDVIHQLQAALGAQFAGTQPPAS